MLKTQKGFLILLLICLFFMSFSSCYGFPSSEYTQKSGYWYDDWDINRNNYSGRNGYLPNLAYETLGDNKDLAFRIGESFLNRYVSKTERATAILNYVQTWTEYGYDEENVFMNGEPQDEWAWNADETAYRFNENTGVVAIGDCEDLAFLCATIYTGAGIEAAIVDAPGHVALLIWLPEYANADSYWDIPDDNRGSGWIWVEATGGSNPLGWTPPDYDDGNWSAYPIGNIEPIGDEPVSQTDFDLILPIIAVGVIMLVLLLASKSRSKQKRNYQNTYYPPPPPPPPPPY